MLATSQKLLAHPQASEIITILAITPNEDDHHTLQLIFNHRNWRLHKARTYGEARPILRESKAAVVICERDLPDGTWKDVLYELALMENSPQLIVVSRLADDHLWAEVLNLGGYDVLQKPFEPSEVMRAVSMAWRQF
jgi:DNA-binding response OmpR family regulator